MNRQIEFRGKRVDNGEWVYGNLIGNDVIVGEVIDFEDDYFTTEFWYRVDQPTVGQFTGIFDKNDKKIYDGDIVRQFADCDEYGTDLYYKMLIKFDEESISFCGINITRSGIDYNDKYYGEDLSSLEVIGNVFDKENK